MQHQFYVTKRLAKFYLDRINFYFVKSKLFFKSFALPMRLNALFLHSNVMTPSFHI